MQQTDQILSELDTYCQAAGMTPEAVCRKATNNPRSLSRLRRRAKQIDRDVQRIRDFMTENPAEIVSENG